MLLKIVILWFIFNLIWVYFFGNKENIVGILFLSKFLNSGYWKKKIYYGVKEKNVLMR